MADTRQYGRNPCKSSLGHECALRAWLLLKPGPVDVYTLPGNFIHEHIEENYKMLESGGYLTLVEHDPKTFHNNLPVFRQLMNSKMSYSVKERSLLRYRKMDIFGLIQFDAFRRPTIPKYIDLDLTCTLESTKKQFLTLLSFLSAYNTGPFCIALTTSRRYGNPEEEELLLANTFREWSSAVEYTTIKQYGRPALGHSHMVTRFIYVTAQEVP